MTYVGLLENGTQFDRGQSEFVLGEKKVSFEREGDMRFVGSPARPHFRALIKIVMLLICIKCQTMMFDYLILLTLRTMLQLREDSIRAVLKVNCGKNIIFYYAALILNSF